MSRLISNNLHYFKPLLYCFHMDFLSEILPWAQVVLSVALIITILLQQSGAGLGGAFGGSDGTAINHTRRGAEKIIFQTTIVIAILFALSAFLGLFI